MARTRDKPVPCPMCGVLTGRVHGFCGRWRSRCRGPRRCGRPCGCRCRHRYATILIDAETGERIDVLTGQPQPALPLHHPRPSRGRSARHHTTLSRSAPAHPPDKLREADTTLLQELAATCPELAELARLVRAFAELLTPAAGNDAKLAVWLTDARAADLPHLHGIANGLELDRDAALTLPYHNGRTEGVITRTKRIMRQTHGRAGFDLLCHRILLL